MFAAVLNAVQHLTFSRRIAFSKPCEGKDHRLFLFLPLSILYFRSFNCILEALIKAMKEYYVRYGRNRNVAWAIVLPCLSIAPFIELMKSLKPMSDWATYLLIFTFFALVILLTIALLKRLYPKVKLVIDDTQLEIQFDQITFHPRDGIIVKAGEIINFSYGAAGLPYVRDYMRFETKCKPYRFQLSAMSYANLTIDEFFEATERIENMIKRKPPISAIPRGL